MKDWMRALLVDYGQEAVLKREEGDILIRAFLQPVPQKGERVPQEQCGIGALDRRLWMYIGQTQVYPGDRLLWEGQLFRVCTGRTYHMGNEKLYYWGTMEPEREAAE